MLNRRKHCTIFIKNLWLKLKFTAFKILLAQVLPIFKIKNIKVFYISNIYVFERNPSMT